MQSLEADVLPFLPSGEPSVGRFEVIFFHEFGQGFGLLCEDAAVDQDVSGAGIGEPYVEGVLYIWGFAGSVPLSVGVGVGLVLCSDLSSAARNSRNLCL